MKNGALARRYEHDEPDTLILIHVDLEKPGNIPAGGDWLHVGREHGGRNRGIASGMITGTTFIHIVIDERSRIA